MGKTCSFENMYLALGHFQSLFYCFYNHWFTSAFQFPDIFHDVYFNTFWVKPLFSINSLLQMTLLGSGLEPPRNDTWDLWGAAQGRGRVESPPEVQSFSCFPNSTQSHVAAPSQLLVRKAQEWDKRAAELKEPKSLDSVSAHAVEANK